MKTLISFAVLSALMSCGPAPELKRRAFLTSTDKSTDASALSFKTDQEIIKLKYNGSVPLKCDFKIMEGSNVDLDKYKGWESTLDTATKEIQWNPFEYKLSGDRVIAVTIMIDSMVIERATKTPVIDGMAYEMSFSPAALVSVKMTESVNGNVINLKTIQKLVIEQVSQSMGSFDLGNDISQDLRCSLATTINDKYSSQWKQKGRKEVDLPEPQVIIDTEV